MSSQTYPTNQQAEFKEFRSIFLAVRKMKRSENKKRSDTL
jgi:hypothetical protein